MGEEAMIGRGIELRFVEHQSEMLRRHLFPGDGDEHGAVLLCGIAREDGVHRFLVRDVILAEDGVEFVAGTRGYRTLTGHFIGQQLRRARDEGLAYLAVHNHGGTDTVSFSGVDLASHERGYPTLLRLSGQPVGAIVFAPMAAAGDIWLPSRDRLQLDRVVIAGSRLDVLAPTPAEPEPVVVARYHRQSLVFGANGQAILRRSKVAIVGAGGVGMLLVQALARLGVGHLIVIDPDRVGPTNLPRLPEATRLDAMEYLDREGVPPIIRRASRSFATPKVRLARRIAKRANPAIRFEGIMGDVADDAVARRITDCDFIFLAADTMLARSVVNQIAYQYLIPTLQVGSKVVIHPDTGAVLDTFAVVRTLGTAPGCLACSGLIDAARLAEESLGDAEQIANQRYVDDPDIAAPSVITLNAMASGWGANDYMQFTTGLGRPAGGYRILRTNPVNADAPHVTVQELDADPACYVCGTDPASVRSRGDSVELPTRIRSPKTRA